MTATVDTDLAQAQQPSKPSSRRALLGAGLGALAATVAGALGRPQVTQATHSGYVQLGHDNPSTSLTKITAPGKSCFEARGWTGVKGYSPDGFGVIGETSSGTGLFGSSYSGMAVRGIGRVRFDRVSGVATIPAGATSVTVDPSAITMPADAFVLLTPRHNIGSRALWYVPDTTASTFKIRMSSSRTSETQIAWLLLG